MCALVNNTTTNQSISARWNSRCGYVGYPVTLKIWYSEALASYEASFDFRLTEPRFCVAVWAPMVVASC